MLSQTSEYALRAMVHLADQPNTPRTARQIADITKVPPRYLSKVLQALAGAGLIEARRGVGGGFTLTRPLKKISVLDVVNVVEPIRRIERCPLGLRGHVKLCPLHQRIDEAISMIETAFERVSLHELVNTQGGSKPLCESTGRRNKAALTVGRT